MQEHFERYLALEACFDSIIVSIAPPTAQSIHVNTMALRKMRLITLRAHWKTGKNAVANLALLPCSASQ